MGGNCNLTTKICDLDVIYIYIYFYPSKTTRPSMFLTHAAVLVITIGCSHHIWTTTHGHAHRQKDMPSGKSENLCRSRKPKASTQKPKGGGLGWELKRPRVNEDRNQRPTTLHVDRTGLILSLQNHSAQHVFNTCSRAGNHDWVQPSHMDDHPWPCPQAERHALRQK